MKPKVEKVGKWWRVTHSSTWSDHKCDWPTWHGAMLVAEAQAVYPHSLLSQHLHSLLSQHLYANRKRNAQWSH